MKSLKVLQTSLGICCSLSVAFAHSAALMVQADYFVAANPNYGIPANTSDNQTQTSDTSASVAVGTNYGSGMRAAYASGYADNTGVIGTGANGVEQNFYANANANATTSIINNTGSAMHYFYTLNIPYSTVGIYANWFGAGDSFTATNQFRVDLNGNTIWGSSASINMTTNGVNFSTSGQTLPWTSSTLPVNALYVDVNGVQGYEGGGNLELSNYSLLLDLGIWGAGQSLSLDYHLASAVSVNAPSSCGYECFNVSAQIGDPSGTSGVPILGTITGAAAVPVPSAVWLFGSGLLGVVGVARRRVA